MTETRDFPSPVIASLSSGVMLCKSFGEIHEAAEYLMGHPIFTHHFADKTLWGEMQRAIAEQCPGMPTKLAGGEAWEGELKAVLAEFGPTVKLRKGSGLTAMLPTDGIPGHVKVIKVQR